MPKIANSNRRQAGYTSFVKDGWYGSLVLKVWANGKERPVGGCRPHDMRVDGVVIEMLKQLRT